MRRKMGYSGFVMLGQYLCAGHAAVDQQHRLR